MTTETFKKDANGNVIGKGRTLNAGIGTVHSDVLTAQYAPAIMRAAATDKSNAYLKRQAIDITRGARLGNPAKAYEVACNTLIAAGLPVDDVKREKTTKKVASDE